MTTKIIQKVNKIYHTVTYNLNLLKKMFRNHKIIKGKIELTEKMLMQVFMSIADKTEQIESNREFNKIIKGIKNSKIN